MAQGIVERIFQYLRFLDVLNFVQCHLQATLLRGTRRVDHALHTVCVLVHDGTTTLAVPPNHLAEVARTLMAPHNDFKVPS